MVYISLVIFGGVVLLLIVLILMNIAGKQFGKLLDGKDKALEMGGKV
jgi:hypothetical protein